MHCSNPRFVTSSTCHVTNQCNQLNGQNGEFWVFHGDGAVTKISHGGMISLVRLELVRAAGGFEVAYDELNGTNNGLMMLMHFEGGKRLVQVSLSMFFVRAFV